MPGAGRLHRVLSQVGGWMFRFRLALSRPSCRACWSPTSSRPLVPRRRLDKAEQMREEGAGEGVQKGSVHRGRLDPRVPLRPIVFAP